MTFGLNQKTIDALNSVFMQYDKIQNVLVYGSRAKGNYRPNSDIDLTIVGDLELRELTEILNKIDDLMLPFSVDLSLFHELKNPDLIKDIQTYGKVFTI